MNTPLILLIISLAVIGLLMIILYWDPTDKDFIKQKDKEKSYFIIRSVGMLIFFIALVLGIYLYYTGDNKFTAQMPGSCNTCQKYVQRHRGLQPYSVNEYQQLKEHAAACNTCSNMCFDEIQLLQQYEPNRYDLRSKKESCAETTKHALLARKELERIETKLRDRQVQYLRAIDQTGGNANWNRILPAPPTVIPK